MANEAVIIELLGNGGDPVRYTCGDVASISKGALLWFGDPRTISGASIAAGVQPFAGVAAHDKVGGDGSTSIACYTNGIFDLTAVAAPAILAGQLVVLSGQNLITDFKILTMSGAAVVGTALETAGASEVIAVRVLV